MTRRGHSGRSFDPQQFQIDWSRANASPPESRARTEGPAIQPPSVRADGLTLRLKWDFRTTFPEPTEQAIEVGTISAEDLHPEGIRSIHEEQTREMLATLPVWCLSNSLNWFLRMRSKIYVSKSPNLFRLLRLMAVQ